MPWNYRIIHHDVDPDPNMHYMALHEVYYDSDDKPNGYGSNPTDFVCDVEEGPEGIIEALRRALKTWEDPRFRVVLKESEMISQRIRNDRS